MREDATITRVVVTAFSHPRKVTQLSQYHGHDLRFAYPPGVIVNLLANVKPMKV